MISAVDFGSGSVLDQMGSSPRTSPTKRVETHQPLPRSMLVYWRVYVYTILCVYINLCIYIYMYVDRIFSWKMGWTWSSQSYMLDISKSDKLVNFRHLLTFHPPCSFLAHAVSRVSFGDAEESGWVKYSSQTKLLCQSRQAFNASLPP